MCVDQIKQIECNQLYIKLIEKYGINAQLIKTAEEAVELAKAALKLQQAHGTEQQEKWRRELAEEIADSQLLIEQLIEYFDLNDLITYYRHMKLQRIKMLIEDGEAT